MDVVRFGLVGYGKVAHWHAQAIKDSLSGTLVSVCGRNEERRNEFATMWGIASRNTIADMVDLDHIDAVIIVTPHPQHHDHALEAFSAGAHVLVEKPMALTEAECTDMILAAERAGKMLSVVSQRRWYPSSLRVRFATILGWRDEAYYTSDPWRGSWKSEGGGICINQAPHQLDLLLWYMGPISRVYSEWDNVNHPYIEVEDTAVATVRFANGGMGSILVSNSQKPGLYAKVHIHGSSGASVGVQTDGGMMFVPGRSVISSPPVNDLWSIEGESALLDTFRQQDEAFFKTIDVNTYFFSRQIDDFSRSITEGCKPMVTGEDGRETVRLIEGIYRSGREHLPVSYS